MSLGFNYKGKNVPAVITEKQSGRSFKGRDGDAQYLLALEGYKEFIAAIEEYVQIPPYNEAVHERKFIKRFRRIRERYFLPVGYDPQERRCI